MKIYYTTREASEMLKIKVRTLRSWIRQGKLKVTKDAYSHKIYISEEEVRRLQNGN